MGGEEIPDLLVFEPLEDAVRAACESIKTDVQIRCFLPSALVDVETSMVRRVCRSEDIDLQGFLLSRSAY